jgi:hypothetical protein
VSTGLAAHVDEPYLSVVVTARNDDHGGNPLYRMQAFVDSLLRQCESHRLPSELIIVEWNPPEDRPCLVDVLSWPETTEWCAVRIIEVPHEMHSRLEHAESLPLFQMIAKNVGIRRARGLFVLATNIDLLFDDALIRRIASRRLQEARLYRVDRFDVPSTIDGAPEEWLDWSRRSVMRVHGAHGSIDTLTGDFYSIGQHSRAGQAVRAAIGRHPRLLLALRVAHARLDELLDRTFVHHTSAEAAHRGKQTRSGATLLATRLALAAYTIALIVRGIGFYVGQGLVFLRDLMWLLRAFTYWFWCGIREPRLVPQRAARRFRRIGSGLVTRGRALRARASGQDLAGVSRRELRTIEFARIQGVLQGMMASWRVRRAMPPLHTNGCGDFTLMARTDWTRTRAYPELQRFSMHIDGLFVYQAHYAGIRERFLPYPIFHIEHGAGFRPDTSSVRELDQRLERDRIRRITDTEFLEWVVEMRSTSGPLAFNDDNWGFGSEPLLEYDPMRAETVVA